MITADTPERRVLASDRGMVTDDTPACRDVTMPIAAAAACALVRQVR